MTERQKGARVRATDVRQKQLLSISEQLAQLRYVPRALGLVWRAAPRWTLVTTLLLVVQGLLPVAIVYLTRALVDGLVLVVQDPGNMTTLRTAVAAAVLMGLVLLAGEAMSSVSGYIRTALAEQVQDQMNTLVHRQAIRLDLHFYESPAYYDQLHRASVEAIDRPLALLDSLGTLLQNTITLVAMSGVLISFAWWMPLALVVGTLPALWVALRTTWKFQQWRVARTVDRRRLNYFHRVLATDWAAAELRLFNLGEHYADAYDRLRQMLRSERLQLAKEQTIAQLVAAGMGLTSFALSLGWVFWQALQGRFSLGDLAMFYQAMNQGQRLMRTILTGVGEIYRNLLFLEDLFSFLELEPLIRAPEAPVHVAPGLQRAVRIDSITFSYPESPRVALDYFSLTIPAGQVVAIVGENGAGKSTLLKLLNRFYDPDEGSITWDGVDLRDMNPADLRRRITVLFQQPVGYHESAADNIGFGDWASNPDLHRIRTAAELSGAASIIERLPSGYATVLSKWFGETDLSVGEWQRVALARAFVREADLVILDEPTSAMDSWAEHAWMTRFRELVANRTALIITHRFTTAMQADVIHVMVGGRIVESGSHQELVAAGGRYAQSWRQQILERGEIG